MTTSLDPLPILGPEGAIARRLPGYEARTQQLEMAQAVAHAIESGEHLMVEAGTGVGKSFAYLVPAILAASEQGKKVVVSTHTIHLQEQLLNKDLPFLRGDAPGIHRRAGQGPGQLPEPAQAGSRPRRGPTPFFRSSRTSTSSPPSSSGPTRPTTAAAPT